MSTADRRDDLLADYLATTRDLVAAQRDVLLTYLGASGAPAVPAPPPLPAAPALSAAPTRPAPVPVPVEAAAPAGPVDVLGAVVAVIADRTGYPPEMIDAELDLEADLSVDSIKRTEIAGLLVDRLGLAGQVDADELDTLSRLRTAGGLAAALRDRTGTDPAPDPVTAAAAEPAAETVGSAPVRHRLVDRAAPLLPGPGIAGRTVTIVGPAGPELADRLVAAGATLAEPAAVPADVLIDLTALADRTAVGDPTAVGDADEPLAGTIAGRARTALAAGCRSLLVAAPAAGPDGLPRRAAGLRGLVRSIAREHPDRSVRLVELATGRNAADVLVEELGAAGPEPVVTRGATRTVPVAEPAELGPESRRGAGPGGIGAAEAALAGLGRESVVLLVGGARGITARCAIALAEAAGGHLHLAGRTPWPAESKATEMIGVPKATGMIGAPEAAAVAGAADENAVRRALAESGVPLPEIAAAARGVLARREVAATLAAVTGAGAVADYHELDVRDGAAVRQLVKDVHNRHGRLDGVVFAAGVLADRLLLESDDAAFATVFGTKVDGVTALFDGLDQTGARPAFVALFGSVAAVLGNRGQTDYAAANDAVDAIGTAWAHRTGTRVLTVHWGPWAPGADHPGMVSPELARDYARRGIGLIDPDAGVAALLRELSHGDPATRAVLYSAGEQW